MARLGFLGLGLMGYPMARNLLGAGHEVALWSNTASKARQLASEEKGIFCETPRQVAEHADCIFLCLGNTAMALEVILGSDGIVHGAKPGTVVADASTISPSESRKIGQALKTEGVDFLDAPCTGSTPGRCGRRCRRPGEPTRRSPACCCWRPASRGSGSTRTRPRCARRWGGRGAPADARASHIGPCRDDADRFRPCRLAHRRF